MSVHQGPLVTATANVVSNLKILYTSSFFNKYLRIKLVSSSVEKISIIHKLIKYHSQLHF